MSIFQHLLRIDCPGELHGDRDDHYAGFEIRFIADGRIPFPQVIVHLPGNPLLLKQEAIQERRRADGTWEYRTRVPEGKIHADTPVTIQVEGCRLADIGQAQGEDWIKAFREVRLVRVPAPEPVARVALAGGVEVKLYFGIHKHLHQPYYNTTDRNAWDGEKEQIFGSRHGNYTDFLPAAVRQYQEGGLAHAGLSTSWSGSPDRTTGSLRRRRPLWRTFQWLESGPAGDGRGADSPRPPAPGLFRLRLFSSPHAPDSPLGPGPTDPLASGDYSPHL